MNYWSPCDTSDGGCRWVEEEGAYRDKHARDEHGDIEGGRHRRGRWDASGRMKSRIEK